MLFVSLKKGNLRRLLPLTDAVQDKSYNPEYARRNYIE